MLRRNLQLGRLYRANCRLSEFSNIKRYRAIPRRYLSQKDVHRNAASVAAHSYVQKVEEKDEFDTVDEKSIDEALSKVDLSARSFGHVKKHQVLSVFETVKSLGKASSIQSLYLLRCCGLLMHDESPSKRTQLANEIWKTMEEFKIPVDASHYNALIKVYLENDHIFSPTEFLAAMEKNGVEPNRVTYQRLIEKYCRDGDLNGASVILEHMKEKEIPVNEAVFNSLIKGHAQTGDFEGAKSMFEVMRKSNLVPGSSTYLALACSYAEKGNLNAVVTTLSEADHHCVYLSNEELLSVVYTLIASGHEDHIDQVLNLITDFYTARVDCVNVVHRLLANGLYDGAFTFIKQVSSHADFRVGTTEYISHFVQKGRPGNEVMEKCKDLSPFHSNPDQIYLSAAKSALTNQLTDCALLLFKEFVKMGIPVRSHYFWPILTHMNKKNEKGMLEIVKVMGELGVSIDIDTINDYILPCMSTDDPDAVVKAIKETKQSEYCVVITLFKKYCASGDYEKAAYLYENYNMDITNVNTLLSDLANSYKGVKSDDISLLKILELLSMSQFSDKNASEVELEARRDICGTFFLKLSNEYKLTQNLLTEAYKMGVPFSNYVLKKMSTNIGQSNPEILQILRSIMYNVPLPQAQKYATYKHPRDMDVDTLEKYVDELKASGTTARVAQRHLLYEYCKARNLDKILAIKKDLDDSGFLYTPAAYAMLIDAFVALHDLERAEELLKAFHEQHPETTLDNVKAINYAILLLKFKRKDEALEFVKKECSDINFEARDILLRNVKRLLNESAETGDVKLTQALFEHFVDKLRLSSPQDLLHPLVKVHLNNGDPEMAINEFIKCLNKYNYAASQFLLLKEFITSNDLVRLQRVVDASTAVNGKVATLHTIASCYLDCGQVQEARKVFQTLGERTDSLYLERMTNRFLKEHNVAGMESLISSTSDLKHVDRDMLYYNLLILCVQDNDWNKALELWNCMQDENIQPSVRTLHTLATLLEKNNQPIPFVIPKKNVETQYDSVEDAKMPISEGTMFTPDLVKYIESQDTENILDTLNKMKKGHIRTLSTDVLTKLVDVFIQKNSLKSLSHHVQLMSFVLEKCRNVFRPLMESYAEKGDIAVFKQLMEFLPDFALKSISFNYFFNKVHIVSGKCEELMSALEANVGKPLKLFSMYGFTELLKKSPELENRAIALAEMFSKVEGFDMPRRALWIYYFTNERNSEAEQIFKEHPELFTAVDRLASPVFREIKSTNSETICRKFIDFLTKYGMKPVVIERAYSCLLDILVNKANHEAAVEVIREAEMAKVPITSFSHRTLSSLKTLLEENGKDVPFELIGKDDESSSSSDSE